MKIEQKIIDGVNDFIDRYTDYYGHIHNPLTGSGVNEAYFNYSRADDESEVMRRIMLGESPSMVASKMSEDVYPMWDEEEDGLTENDVDLYYEALVLEVCEQISANYSEVF